MAEIVRGVVDGEVRILRKCGKEDAGKRSLWIRSWLALLRKKPG
jgi:hypothetical protein